MAGNRPELSCQSICSSNSSERYDACIVMHAATLWDMIICVITSLQVPINQLQLETVE